MGTGSVCGDLELCPETEACDDGFTDACGSCNADCSGSGTGSSCGDMEICPETEVCDGVVFVDDSCEGRGFTAGTLSCIDTCTVVSDSSCIAAQYPTVAGELVITELMPEPDALSDGEGEWLELHNPNDEAAYLGGCTLTDGGTEIVTLASDLVVEPGVFLGLSRGAEPGFREDVLYGDALDLATEDTVRLECPVGADSLVVSEVVYSAANGFSVEAGKSLALDPEAYLDPDPAVRFASGIDGASWCAGFEPYSLLGDLGSPQAPNPSCFPPSLLFSEYVEGDSQGDLKALEIVNQGDGPLPLAGCALEIYGNGVSTMPVVYDFPDVELPSLDVFVVCGQFSAGEPFCDGDGRFNFDGNDAIALVCPGWLIDVIGQIGQNPGTAWSGGGVSTANQTLRRKCTVTVGDSNGNDAFDPSLEWDSAGADDVSNLGVYHCP